MFCAQSQTIVSGSRFSARKQFRVLKYVYFCPHISSNSIPPYPILRPVQQAIRPGGAFARGAHVLLGFFSCRVDDSWIKFDCFTLI